MTYSSERHRNIIDAEEPLYYRRLKVRLLAVFSVLSPAQMGYNSAMFPRGKSTKRLLGENAGYGIGLIVYSSIQTVVHLIESALIRLKGGDPHLEAMQAAGYFTIVLIAVWCLWPIRMPSRKTPLSIISNGINSFRRP